MSLSRRHFSKLMAGALIAGPSVIQARREEVLPYDPKAQVSGRVRIASIGMGIQGFHNTNTAIKVEGVELVAVCDLYIGRLQRCQEVYGDHIFTTQNYQEILTRDDVDAVIISTSDHWHDKMTIAALEAGKHVYCEKPMVHHINEGKAVIRAANKSGLVVQVGSQRVSSLVTLKAAELYAEGAIGDLVLVSAADNRQSALGAWQYSIPTDAGTDTVAWDRFVGDAPKVGYSPEHFFRWRNYQAYGTGVAGDLFVHLFSALHAITKSIGPTRIVSAGGLRYWNDGRDVPDVMSAIASYPDAPTHKPFDFNLVVNFIDGSAGGGWMRLIGTEGMLDVQGSRLLLTTSVMSDAPGYGGWDSLSTFSEEEQKKYVEWYKSGYPAPTKHKLDRDKVVYKTPPNYSDHYDHFLNFFNTIREEAQIHEDATFGLRAAAPALACNKSYFTQKPVHWNPDKMKLA